MREPGRHVLVCLIWVYAVASLVHFTHNAEFLADYPNLPAFLSRLEIYAAWFVMTFVGVIGWLLISRGWLIAGLMALVAYAALGLDSLGHYAVAPFSAHTLSMNATILAEVVAAGLLLVEVSRQIVLEVLGRASERDA